MADKKRKETKLLTEQMVRNEDLFCSLLLDENNSTLRVVDFRGGNFQQKQNYLKRIQLAEGFRKIFTLIERDDMQGWQRSGYLKEGSIPGYYRRSDAYLMGWVTDSELDAHEIEEESEIRKEYIQQVKDLAEEYVGYKKTGFTSENMTVEEVPDFVKDEYSRRNAKSKAKSKITKLDDSEIPTDEKPLFMQFSRGVEYYYHGVFNKRTKQGNLFAAEYQDCFGNAKLDVFFKDIKNKADIALFRSGLLSFVDWLGELGAVAIFSFVDTDNTKLNAAFASCGFKNSGWLNEQIVEGKKTKDQILWTIKLAI